MAFIKHNGRTVCFRLLGDRIKPLLMLAHPLGMTQGVWDDMLPALLEKFRVLTWDLPGHGASAAWPDESDEITPEDLAQEAIALARVAESDRFHFVGTSIGGVIGQQLLSEHADKLLSTTLTNTGAVIGTPEAWDTRSANVLELGLSAMAADIVPRWFGPATCEQQPTLVEGWCVIMGRGDDRSYALLCEMLGRVDFREQCQATDVPLQLIGGSDDVATPPEILKALANVIGAADPIILEHVGHVPSVERPEVFSQMLLGNLD
ncbi:alpha/beta fold hydrolase [Marinobacter sp. 1_MG-2023]|uniref:alpha/beta fold hydrolase n=1 Tax=Marinobacter sp. 1_MG-2023 TaxID=3062627 RepID=UPI0026E324F1|nr:alpha/beta fold hydrolase [Marinobacter sp. 1_MG-2023]MDO6824187.1 alpha/beta fold hydrolase [Marinobacter sp. 1_MG-2023]